MSYRDAKVTVPTQRERRQAAEAGGKRSLLFEFKRGAARNELNGREGALTEAEQRTAATLDRLSREIFRVHRGQQALFGVIDTLVKTFLTCVPEPPKGGMAASVARARGRSDRFVRSARQAMAGDAHAAMQDLVSRDA